MEDVIYCPLQEQASKLQDKQSNPQSGLQKCQEGHQQEQAFTTQGLVTDFLSSDLHKSGASRLREALICKSGALCAP